MFVYEALCIVPRCVIAWADVLQSIKQALRTGYSKANLGITHTESLFAGYNRESEVNLTKSSDTRAFNPVLQSADYIAFNTEGVHV